MKKLVCDCLIVYFTPLSNDDIKNIKSQNWKCGDCNKKLQVENEGK